MNEVFSTSLDAITKAVEALGVLIIVIGAIFALGRYLHNTGASDAYRQLRSTLGRAILLGLELLVAADIINTVAIEPTLDSLAILAGIVLIRTFLSLSLEVEIDGRWPWQRDRQSARHRD
jgi:uncharacterized membrane protein